MDLVVGASKFAANNLGTLVAQYTLIRGVRDDIQYINDELASMQAFLNRLKRAATRDEQQEEWMRQVKGVANDIADYVDYVHLRLGGEPRGSGKLVYLRRKWYLLTTLYARHCIATDISNLKVRAQHVSERRTRYGVEIPVHDGLGGRPLAKVRQRQAPPPPLLIGTVAPVGIDDACLELEPWFMEAKEQTTNDQPRFLTIVGFSCLGKTTLALALYHRFGYEFDCRASVLASPKFHLQTVLRSLIKQFHKQQDGASRNDINGIEELKGEELKNLLAQQLKGKRYHIMIDDIWSVSAWESIRDTLPKSKKGNSIVVTTRFKSVAEACRRQRGLIYELRPLSQKNSYKLFCQIISSAPKVPTEDARAVLKKCGGLPLAIILVAGLVASKLRSESDTTQIDYHHLAQVDKDLAEKLEKNKAPAGKNISAPLEKLLAQVGKDLGDELEKDLSMDGVIYIVNHCYSQLPPELKTCLLYLSMFPKGCLISRKRLMRRWIAEGFIAEKHGKMAEEVAEDYFNELISRNLIRAVNSSSKGKVKSYQVHDMVHEYIVVKSSYENFVTVVGTGSQWHKPFPGEDNFSMSAKVNVRWLSIQNIDLQEKIEVERMKLLHVRSLTVLGGLRDLHSTLLKFQLLEVLDLEDCKDLSFNHLKKICKMLRLKYVSLRRTDIDKIPKEISSLEYLQVLDIRDTNILQLPPSVAKLQNMTHLLAGSKSKRVGLTLTEEITKMMALQTLSGVEICGISPNAAWSGSTNGEAEKPATLTMSVSAKHADGYCGHWQCKKSFRCKAARTSLAKGLRALENLANLKKLTVYKLRAFTNEDNILLLSAIEHLSSCSLKFLAIDDDFTGFLDSYLNVSHAPPEHLHSLGLSGKLSQLPGWIGRLHSLENLTLSLTALTTRALLVLSELPELFSLIFTLDSTKKKTSALQIVHQNAVESGGEIFVLAGGFEKLKLLRFVTPVLPPLRFLEGAMPKLESLELKFIMAEDVYGMENLVSLRQVVLPVSSQALEVTRVKVSQMKTLASMHPKHPSVVVDEYKEL